MGEIKSMTKEVAFKIIEMHKKGTHINDIVKFCGFSNSFVSNFVRAYNGNTERLIVLAKPHQDLIKEISPNYTETQTKIGFKEKSRFVEYECKLLFGLITLKFKPKC
jgi:predicted transcriptional regulator